MPYKENIANLNCNTNMNWH